MTETDEATGSDVQDEAMHEPEDNDTEPGHASDEKTERTSDQGIGGCLPAGAKLEVDDWVVVHKRLASIVRFGYGDYENQVRILFPNESTKDWTAGRWQVLSGVTKLVLPSQFVIDDDVVTADAPGLLAS